MSTHTLQEVMHIRSTTGRHCLGPCSLTINNTTDRLHCKEKGLLQFEVLVQGREATSGVVLDGRIPRCGNIKMTRVGSSCGGRRRGASQGRSGWLVKAHSLKKHSRPVREYQSLME